MPDQLEKLPQRPAAPEQQPEKGTAETAAEQVVEQPTVAPAPDQPEPVLPSTPAGAPTIAQPQDELLEDIEDILEDDLEEVFATLPPDSKEEFKHEGEETAHDIREIVDKPKFSDRSIFQLIKKWLRMIPGVNRFFLEQEAKIKTDEIVDLTDKQKDIP